jgi:hypothetical protein
MKVPRRIASGLVTILGAVGAFALIIFAGLPFFVAGVLLDHATTYRPGQAVPTPSLEREDPGVIDARGSRAV